MKWHDEPYVSVVMNRDPAGSWVRYEMLLPHTESIKRPNVRIYKEKSPTAYKTFEDMFNAMWDESGTATMMTRQ